MTAKRIVEIINTRLEEGVYTLRQWITVRYNDGTTAEIGPFTLINGC